MVGRKEYHEAIAKLLLGKDKLTSPGKADLGQASCDALLTSTYKTLTSDHYLALKVRERCGRELASRDKSRRRRAYQRYHTTPQHNSSHAHRPPRPRSRRRRRRGG